MKKLIFSILLAVILLFPASSAITPNPLISQGKTIYTSKGNFNNLVDNVFQGSTISVSDNSWIAVPIDSGPSKVFFNWNNPDYWWSGSMNTSSCPATVGLPVDYDFLISSNSTNGNDGTWTIVDSVRGNIVTARGHLLNTPGAKWVKMQIKKGNGTIDEIQLFNASNGSEDTWLFVGTSISAAAFKGTPPASNFADLVHSNYPSYFPAIVRGAIACISSNELVNNLSKYLKLSGNVKYWAIEMGTNDAWGGTNSNVANFKSNMQKVIDSCKVHGIIPILAKVLATNKTAAGWQIHPDFEKAIDELTSTNNLIAGPDLYTWFLAHPDNLNTDGVHPNSDGAADIQRLWYLKLDSLYGGCVRTEITPYYKINKKDSVLSAVAVMYTHDSIKISPVASDQGGTWSWTGPNSFTADTREIILNDVITTQGGTYVCMYTNSKGCKSNYSFRLWVNKRVGVESANSVKDAEIFPNPSGDGNFTVVVENLRTNAQLQIFDMQGKLLLNNSLKQNRFVIYSGLPKGIFSVKVINGNIVTDTNIVIK